MTEKEYRSAPGVNKSTLWNLRKSPAHYKYFMENPQEDTTAMKLGRAVHSLILTPNLFPDEFATLPDGIDRRTKAGKEAYEEFMQQNAGKDILSVTEAAQIGRMAAAVWECPEVEYLLRDTDREKPFFWTDDNGIDCKCRMDAITDGRIIDLKTTTDAETDVFSRDALRYGYHVQAAHYIDAYYKTVRSKTPDWYFIVVEKSEPYCVNILKADIGFLDHGFIVRQELIKKLMECRKTDSYPGYGVNDLCLPAWMEA